MAIPKVIGTETEYGIAAVGSPEFNPVISSSLLISTYAGALRGSAGTTSRSRRSATPEGSSRSSSASRPRRTWGSPT